ncbi:hypothetical protein F5X68DRAFT_201628 [Plectosphaerella plurivora]|uniref:Uncharacterized protein n=1 Tax=Plectosphaerella plurivora TaxID=936078 RepID=A0A9P9ADE8_9PEZI|nr:hypothetical protein F5X68DRAFT_201628 [Plectosphaerella plurivora]
MCFGFDRGHKHYYHEEVVPVRRSHHHHHHSGHHHHHSHSRSPRASYTSVTRRSYDPSPRRSAVVVEQRTTRARY